jgi:hypothetical protein
LGDDIPLQKRNLSLPWMLGAYAASLQNGFAAPGYTGMSLRLMASRMLNEFLVVFGRELLP